MEGTAAVKPWGSIKFWWVSVVSVSVQILQANTATCDLMGDWDSTARPSADINKDGIVNSVDTSLMMGQWSP